MNEFSLGDICHITDGAHSKVDRQTNGRLYLTSKNIRRGNLDLDNVDYISDEDFNKLFPINSKAGRRPQKGDILIGIIGTFGNAYVYKDSDEFGMSSSVGLVRPKPNLVDSDYLFYVITGKKFEALINSFKSGSVQGYTNIPTLKKIPLSLPTLTEQKAIAHILGTLDAKIEINRQMNQKLEAMAHALFKSWFVDFDPVLDNALAAGQEIPDELQAMAEKRRVIANREARSGKQSNRLIDANPDLAAKFPSSFVFNETLGKWIPEGWEVNEIKKIAKPIKENKKATEISDTDIYVGLEHIQRKSLFLSENGFGSDITSNKSAFKKGDILFGKLRPYFHKICIAPINGVCSTDILIFRPRKIDFSSFLTYFLFQEELVEYVNMRSTGTRMPRANQNDILSYKFALPKNQILISFENLIRPATGKALSNIEENKTLTQLRDRLLPELISGKVRVKEGKVIRKQL